MATPKVGTGTSSTSGMLRVDFDQALTAPAPAAPIDCASVRPRREGAKVKAGSPYRAIAPTRPASRDAQPSELNFDKIINLAIHRLIALAADREDPLRQRLASLFPVLARKDGERKARERLTREEGLLNSVTYLRELVARADLRTGFVGRPPARAGQRWERWKQYQLGTFAFGQYVPGEVGASRGKRADQRLKEIGFITRKQVARQCQRPDGLQWVRDVSVVHVTPLFWSWLGLLDEWRKAVNEKRKRGREAVRADVRAGERAEGEARAQRLAQSQTPPLQVTAQAPSPAPAVATAVPPPILRSDRPPPSGDDWAARFQHVEDLLKFRA